jgi:hypothetical protein
MHILDWNSRSSAGSRTRTSTASVIPSPLVGTECDEGTPPVAVDFPEWNNPARPVDRIPIGTRCALKPPQAPYVTVGGVRGFVSTMKLRDRGPGRRCRVRKPIKLGACYEIGSPHFSRPELPCHKFGSSQTTQMRIRDKTLYSNIFTSLRTSRTFHSLGPVHSLANR